MAFFLHLFPEQKSYFGTILFPKTAEMSHMCVTVIAHGFACLILHSQLLQ